MISFVDVGLSGISAVLFAAVNIPILRLIVAKIYNLRDTTLQTASIVVGAATLVYFVLSFFLSLPYLPGISFILAMAAFLVLLKKSYSITWSKTVLVWLVWVGAFVFQGMVIFLAVTPFL